ncbi:MAG: hypothetical protein ABJE47_22390 [bacterium]
MTEQQSGDAPLETPTPSCPKCQGDMWDNRVGKRNPKAPDFKCKDRECDGVVWPSREAVAAALAAAGSTGTSTPAASAATSPVAAGMPNCPVCGGPMWDDRLSKRNPRAPDFKCRNKPKERGGPGCEGVIWPSRDGSPSPYPSSAPRKNAGGANGMSASPYDDTPSPDGPPPFDDAPPHSDDDLPF